MLSQLLGAVTGRGPFYGIAITSNRAKDPLRVVAQGGWLRAKYQYPFSYKGLAFFASSNEPWALPTGCEAVTAEGIWMPG
jgi:hypothetical protein